jgi:molybdopterin/thiamine biosynthesis adenylyltransferase/rhodanese-related sulfurtransferase
MLSASELSRYGRQILLPEVGVAGQERLRAARVLVVGAGGLGSPAALYLAAAGVGTLGLMDSDRVELSNLHRQVLHGTADVDRAKTVSAGETLGALNPHVTVRQHSERLSAQNAERILGEYDLVVDGSDNYSTRYAVNDACVHLDLPWVYASVERFSGQISFFPGGAGPCYRCLYPDAPQPGTTASCDEIGVLGVLPGIMGTMQASEALKWLLGVGEPLIGKLVTFDVRTVELRTVAYDRNPACTVCGPTGDTRARRAPSIEEGSVQLEPREVAALISGGSDLLLLDVREPWEYQVARIDNSQLVPMNELPARLGSIDRSRDIVVYCHHGMRSDMAAEWLRSQGFPARNLAGGIDRWSREVDPAIPRY